MAAPMSLPPGLHAVLDGHLATIVTYLEMRAPPAPRSDPPSDGLTLTRLEAPSPDRMRAMIRAVGTDWLWQAVLSMPEGELAAMLGDRGYEVHGLRRDGAEVGLVALDYRAPGECEIAFFGVTPDAVGTGAARWAMNRTLEMAWARDIGRLWLHTCTLDHPGALAFYRRTGFTPTHQEVEVLPDPRLRGLLPMEAGPHIPLAKGAPAG